MKENTKRTRVTIIKYIPLQQGLRLQPAAHFPNP